MPSFFNIDSLLFLKICGIIKFYKVINFKILDNLLVSIMNEKQSYKFKSFLFLSINIKNFLFG